MYRCQICGRAAGPRVPAYRVVTKTRNAIYPYRARSKKVLVKKNGKRKREWQPDFGGTGVEIACEAVACPKCAISAAS